MRGHLVPLGGGWGLWPSFCLRAAGFPIEMLDGPADPALAALADTVNARADAGGDPGGGGDAGDDWVTRFAAAAVAVGRALQEAAAEPRIREAVAWQNAAALGTGFDTLLRRDPATVARTGRHRKTEALVTGYLHRYCAKNETIGFFGPLRWGRIDPDPAGPAAAAVDDGTGGSRTLYLEGWAVAALGRALAPALRPWLVPRLMPLLDVHDGTLRAPSADPVPLDPVTVGVVGAFRPGRRARDVVAAARASVPTIDAAAAWDALERLHARHRIEWTLEVPADDLHALDAVRATLRQIDDPAVRGPALAALDRWDRALTTVEAARGDACAVVESLAGLGAEFTALTGHDAVRAPGEVYAGRTLVFEEVRRPDTLVLGPAALDPLRAPLALLLDSARWYTAAGAALYRRALRAVFDELTPGRAPGAPLPFAELWLAAADLLTGSADAVVRPLVTALTRRWERVLAVPDGVRRVRSSAAALRAGVDAAFPAGPPGWPAAVHHSPDLMLAAPDLAAVRSGDVEWVLGELHPGFHTMRYASWVDAHPDPAELAAAMAADLPGGVVRAGATLAQGGSATRHSPRLVGPADRRLVFAPDTCGHDPDRDLVVGACDVVDRGGRLLVVRRSDGAAYDLIEVLADLVAATLMPHFRVLSPAAHRPRVTIDRLVVHRESWTVPADTLRWPGEPDEAARFLAVRRWAAGQGLPRHVFVRTTGERKPVHVDLASLASIEVLARAVRRAVRVAGPDARVTVTEMLPTPDRMWLTDAADRRYSAELRFVAAPL